MAQRPPFPPPLDLDGVARRLRAQPAARLDPPGARRAAVALVLSPALDVLFIRRSERAGDPWSGHMALPGGRVEPEDAGPRAAAVRETHEEVGLDLSGARFLGPLDELSSPVRKGREPLVISPFAFALEARRPLRPNEEVAEVHWLGLPGLLAGEGRGTFDLRWQGRTVPMPILRAGTADIWGLTLRIVDDLVGRLASPPSSP